MEETRTEEDLEVLEALEALESLLEQAASEARGVLGQVLELVR